MDAASSKFPKAFAVPFRNLDRWDTRFFRKVLWAWPLDFISRLGRILERKQHPVRAVTNPREIPIIEKITFGGRVSVKDVEKRTGYKGRLFWAYPGDLIYSKIRAKQGSLAIISEEIGNLAVSSEYPVYSVNEKLCDRKYLELVLKSAVFKDLLSDMSHGGSTKTRMPPEEFESLTIPLPPLPVQKAIVDHWYQTLRISEISKRSTAELTEQIEQEFLAALDLQSLRLSKSTKYFAVSWRNLQRWGLNYNQTSFASDHLSGGRHKAVDLGSVLNVVQYGTSEKADFDQHGTPILRMNNIANGYVDLRNLKYVKLSDRERLRLLVQDGDILFNRTNSKELVGKCAVFRENGEYVFASYLIRLRVNPDQALPEFVAHAINSPIGRLQINALSRQIIGQANINTHELRSLRVPLPALSTQVSIMRRVAEIRSEIVQETERIKQLQSNTQKEVEEMILGVRPVMKDREA